MPGKYAIPEEIRAMNPRGTMVKRIPSGYYVYEYKTVRDEAGKRKTKIGACACIGKIDSKRGSVSNASSGRSQEWRTLVFGQWAVADDLSRRTYALLREFLNAEDAGKIYLAALCHFAEDLTFMKDVRGPYC